MPNVSPVEEGIELRFHGDPTNPALIYLPGLHGDWTLIATFRKLIAQNFYLVEFTYPRSLTWNLTDCAHAIETALLRAGVRQGWILAESFSSQILWEMLEDNFTRKPYRFLCDGIILAGGFVKYPANLVLKMVAKVFDILPWAAWKCLFWVYAKYSHFRHRNAPESAVAVREFLARRTRQDIAAMRHRLDLISAYDPRPIVKNLKTPIYLLAGIVDPIVPTWPVLRWLRRNSSAFVDYKIIFPADHNVLGTEPSKSAKQIESWICKGEGSSKKPPKAVVSS